MVASPAITRGALKADCTRKDLLEAVQTVGHAVSGRATLPILNHILIQSEDNGLRLLAADLELSISCRIPARVEEVGSLTAPARTLTEVLANFPEICDIAMSVDKSHMVRLNSERSDYKILGLSSEDYVGVPEVSDAVSFAIPHEVLRQMIQQSMFAASTDETRPILTGMLMVFDGESLKLVATDTHRLAVRSAPVHNGAGSQNAIVPLRAMNELARLLPDASGDVEVSISANHVRFALPGEAEVRIVTVQIEGQFPNYQRVVPTEWQHRLTTMVPPFLAAVRRAAIVARDNANRVILRSEGDKLIITAECATVGNAYEEMELVQEPAGENVEIAFNARYLLDVLNVLGTEGTHMEMTAPLKPAVLRPVANEQSEGPNAFGDYLCVLMPMQID